MQWLYWIDPRPCLTIAGVSLHHGGQGGSERRRLRMVSEGLPVCVKARGSAIVWKSSRGMMAAEVAVRCVRGAVCVRCYRYRRPRVDSKSFERRS